MSSIYHKIYVALGGKKGSFLQRHWERFRTISVSKKKSKLLPVYGMEMLKIFRITCEECGVKGWLEYGTLLGAYREKSFIPHDNDLDVGMYADEYSLVFEQSLLNYGFIKKHEYYLVNATNNSRTLTEVGFSYYEFTIDIFLTEKGGDTRKAYVYLFDTFDDSPKLKVKYFTLQQVEPLQTLTIDGEPFLAPRLPEDTLAKVYGDDFMTPQRGWMPSTSNPNVTYVERDAEYGEHIIF